MRHRVRISLVLVIAIAGVLCSSACDSEDADDNTPLQPTKISSAFVPTFGIGVRPDRLIRRSIPGAICPFQQPFLVPFEVFLENTSASDVFLSHVGAQFVDALGTAGPQFMSNQPSLTRQFGNVGLAPRTSRAFPFSIEFGCGVQPTGTLSVLVGTIDGSRREQERRFTVAVR